MDLVKTKYKQKMYITLQNILIQIYRKLQQIQQNILLTWLLLNDPILYVVLGHVTRTRCFYANLKVDKFRDVYRIFKTEI
jgi:hypothetical protein